MAKVILTHEVTGLGEPGDIVDVKNGYARNYLLPRKLATAWSKGGEKEVQALRRARRARALASAEDAQAAQERLAGLSVRVAVRAGSTGRLFGTVTTADIADAVRAAGGPKLDRRKIEIDSHIKTVGDYTVKIRLHESVQAKLTITVAPE
ncbi:MAG: 50S ribosomal protein L9 [Bifidobacteriaceae bacterium]|jgi:large subunit ribosomal protein L9|nr:50S ribosomal protein L9 [Bifidobacteriaceae bacterium]